MEHFYVLSVIHTVRKTIPFVRLRGNIMKKKNFLRMISAIICTTLLLPGLISCSVQGENYLSNKKNEYKVPLIFNEGKTDIGNVGYTPSYSREDIPASLSGAYISADKSEGGLLKLDTTFTVKTAGECSAEDVLKYIVSSPSINFGCTEKSEGEYTLTPSSALKENTVYRLSVGIDNPISSFAFQTESVFSLDSAFPANDALDVPVDCGIELRFTEAVGHTLSEMGKYISLSPSVKGEFMLYPDKKTIVFIPKNKLSLNTVYYVTISGDITGQSGRTLGEDMTLRFRTSPKEVDENDVTYRFDIGTSMPVFAPGDSMYLTYRLNYYAKNSNDIKHGDARVKVYRFSDADSAVSAMKDAMANIVDLAHSGEKYLYDTKALTLVYDEKVTPVSERDRYYSDRYVSLPALDEGSYLVCLTPTASLGDMKMSGELQAFVSVSDYTVYTESSGNTLIWINSVSGRSVENIDIRASLFTSPDGWDVENTESAYTEIETKTDSAGIAHLITSDFPDANRTFVIVDNSLVLCLSSLNRDINRPRYASFIYTDRETYFSSDRVNFSGMISPVFEDTAIPEHLYLTTSLSPTKQEIKVNPDGSFEGSFSYEDYVAYYRSGIHMNFTDENGISVASKYVYVTAEEKPVYTASLSFDRMFYEFGDTGTLTLNASFFDGTPAPGLSFSVYCDEFLKKTFSGVTDENGQIVIPFVCAAIRIHSTSPSTVYASAHLTGYENVSLDTSADTVYFQSKYYLRSVYEGESVSVLLNEFDTSNLLTEDDLSWRVFPENCIGDPADGKVTAILKKITYIKTENSSQYNPITKKTEKTYYYRSVESTVSSKVYSFENGKITLPCLERENDCSYFYEISYYDAQNSATVKLHSSAVKNQSNYHLNIGGDYYRLESSHEGSGFVKNGESVEYTLKYGLDAISDKKIIHTVYTAKDGGIYECAVTNGSFKVLYNPDFIFGVRIKAAVFDGRKVQTVYLDAPGYDYESENLLDITVSPDSDTFKLGEECTVSITARTADGKAASGAKIKVGIVDEACFALGDQELNALRDFFELYIPSPAINSRFDCFNYSAGYYYYSANGMMKDDLTVETESADEAMPEETGKGQNRAEGDFDKVTLREYFADNPLFESVTLDRSGRATIKFKIPDNITEWRISAVGYTAESSADEVCVGSTTSSLIATLPFFLNVSLSDTYVVGDDISANVRVYGSGVTAGNKVSYLAALTDYDGNIIDEMTVEGLCGEYSHIILDKCDAGSYCLTVKAISGEYSDGVKLPFNVAPDGISMTVNRTLGIDELSSVSPTLYPVYLTFVNPAYSDYLDIVGYILSQSCNRTDALAARYVAEMAHDAIFGTGKWNQKQLDEIKKTVSSYSSNGLIPLMSYSEGDIVLTAKIAAISPELISANGKTMLISICDEMIREHSYQSDVELSACLLTLAALGEPVLRDILTFASYELSLEAKLYLSFALAIIGDYSSASELYSLALDGIIVDDGDVYVAAASTEESIRLTALALMSASYIDSSRALGMAKHIMSRQSSLDLYTLEMASYVKCFYPVGAAEVTFEYSVDGGDFEKISLKASEGCGLCLGKAAFESLKVRSDDDIIVKTSYLGSVSEALAENGKDEKATLKKTIEPYDLSRGLYKVTISYTVTFDSNHLNYTLFDRIPSGARYYGAYQEKANGSDTDKYSYAYLSNDDSQMMHGYIGMYNPTEKYISGRTERSVSGNVSYLIRAAGAGEFAVSPAIMQNSTNGNYALSEGGRVIIGENISDVWKIEMKK